MAGSINYPAIQQSVDSPPLQPLSLEQRAMWNNFIGYLKQKGMQGNSALDDRNKALGQQLMTQYALQNPSFTLKYSDVPRVQQDIQNYRQQLINQ